MPPKWSFARSRCAERARGLGERNTGIMRVPGGAAKRRSQSNMCRLENIWLDMVKSTPQRPTLAGVDPSLHPVSYAHLCFFVRYRSASCVDRRPVLAISPAERSPCVRSCCYFRGCRPCRPCGQSLLSQLRQLRSDGGICSSTVRNSWHIVRCGDHGHRESWCSRGPGGDNRRGAAQSSHPG